MPRIVKTPAAEAALGTILEEAAEKAAGNNSLVSKTEQKTLPEFLQAEARAMRESLGKGARIEVGPLVAAASERARQTWERFNPPGTRDGETLARAEVRAIAAADAPLGELTLRAYERVRLGDAPPPAPWAPIPIREATFTSNDPNARLERVGDTFVLVSQRTGTIDPPGQWRTGVIAFDGQRVEIQASADRLFGAYSIGDSMPEGYAFENVGVERQGDVLRSTFRITKDPAGTLTTAEARSVAQAELLRYLRDVRMHEPDWQSNLMATTWDQIVAAGALDDIARFGDTSAGEGEVRRTSETYLFSGRGPLGLYTDVDVSKADGKVTRVYIEID